jgi:hypothetical protein
MTEKKKLYYTGAYLLNQGFAVVATILAIRLGKEAFTLEWVAGSLLALGWGASVFGMIAPALSARLWSLNFRTGLRESLVVFGIATFAVIALLQIPALLVKISSVNPIGMHWIAILTLCGALRSFTQGLTVFPIRGGFHTQTISFQLIGRLGEIVLIVLASLIGSKYLFIGAWCMYPAWQGLLLIMVPQGRIVENGLTVQTSHWHGHIISGLGQVADLIVPSLWFSLGGAQVMVVYKAASSAVDNCALVPRYWFTISQKNLFGHNNQLIMGGFVVMAASVVFVVFTFASGAIPGSFIVFGMIAVFLNSIAAPSFSKIRQYLLNNGELVIPALAVLLARLVEATLLLLIVKAVCAPIMLAIIAYAGFATRVAIIKSLMKGKRCCDVI